MYICESWTIKKTEHQRIDAFKLQHLWALLRVPWTGRRSNKSISKEINPFRFIGRTDAEAEAPLLWFPDIKELTHWKRPQCWERLKAGGEGDNRGWDDWMASLTRWTWVWVSSRSWWWTGKPGMLQSRIQLNWINDTICSHVPMEYSEKDSVEIQWKRL